MPAPQCASCHKARAALRRPRSGQALCGACFCAAFEAEVLQNKAMGFDGKSLINPKQIRFVHQVFAPTEKEIVQAEKIVRAYREQSAAGVGVFTVDGKMIDIAFIPGAERTLKLARACGLYEGDLV